jgi:hypothetical protein
MTGPALTLKKISDPEKLVLATIVAADAVRDMWKDRVVVLLAVKHAVLCDWAGHGPAPEEATTLFWIEKDWKAYNEVRRKASMTIQDKFGKMP